MTFLSNLFPCGQRRHKPRHIAPLLRRLTFGLLLALGLGECSAALADKPDWLTGPALQAQRRAVISTLTWSNQPLEEALQSFSEVQRVAIFRDRRVDPNHTLRLALENVTIGEVPALIAETLKLGTCDVNAISYLGPPSAASELRTLIALRYTGLARLPAAKRAVFRSQREMQWEELVTPAELLQQLAAEAGVEIVGMERLPHDLWAAQQFPALSWIERMSLLLVGFDLTFDWEAQGSRIRLEAIAHPVALVRHYAVSTAIRSIESRAAELVPQARFKVVGERMYVKGRLEDHETIDALLRGETAGPARTSPRRGAPLGETRIARFAVRNKPLKPVVEQLARGLSMQIVFDEAAAQEAGIALDQLVSAEIENATIDQAIAALLSETGLAFERREGQIVIRPVR